jgi:transposase
MRSAKVFPGELGAERAVMQDRVFAPLPTGQQAYVVRVRPTQKEQSSCAVCSHRYPGYDRGDGLRRWRAMDLGMYMTWVETEVPRGSCRCHGVWEGNGFRGRALARAPCMPPRNGVPGWRCTPTRPRCRRWCRLPAVVERVANAALAQFDPLQGLLRTGIDEVAYRKGHHYLTVVLDHDCGRLLCASSGRNEETLHCFFDALGPVRCKQLQLVSADASSYIANVVKERCLSAVPCSAWAPAT